MNTDFARQQMVEQQVRAWDVFDTSILDVLRTVPRERFVPSGYESLAFADTEIPLAHGQSMMTPTLEGRVLQALDVGADDAILEIGTGSGFLTACLASLGASVTSIDIHEDFLTSAAHSLDEAGMENIELLSMDATKQLPDGHFDAIAVTGSIQRFDPRFVDALTIGGRLFVVVGDAPAMDAHRVIRTADSDWASESLFETDLAPLVNGAPPPRFSF